MICALVRLVFVLRFGFSVRGLRSRLVDTPFAPRANLPHAAAAAAAASADKVGSGGELCFSRYRPRRASSSSSVSCPSGAGGVGEAFCAWCEGPMPPLVLPTVANAASSAASSASASSAATALSAVLRFCGWECGQAAALRSGSSAAIRRQVSGLKRYRPPPRLRCIVAGQSIVRSGGALSHHGF